MLSSHRPEAVAPLMLVALHALEEVFPQGSYTVVVIQRRKRHSQLATLTRNLAVLACLHVAWQHRAEHELAARTMRAGHPREWTAGVVAVQLLQPEHSIAANVIVLAA